MKTLTVPRALRERLTEPASEGLFEMFAQAHALATASFERRLAEELSKLRFEMTNAMSNLKFDLLKWCFFFWIGQLAAMTAIMSLLLQP
jgi:hypothetical protein